MTHLEPRPDTTSTPPAPSTASAASAPQRDPLSAGEVFYDGACPICRAEIDLYRRAAEPETKWRDVADPRLDLSDDLPAGLDRADLLARMHVRRRNGDIAQGFAAFVAIWRATPRLAPLGRALDRQPFLWLGERLYRLFLAIRPLWRRTRA